VPLGPILLRRWAWHILDDFFEQPALDPVSEALWRDHRFGHHIVSGRMGTKNSV
jgi:hypothetical protein